MQWTYIHGTPEQKTKTNGTEDRIKIFFGASRQLGRKTSVAKTHKHSTMNIRLNVWNAKTSPTSACGGGGGAVGEDMVR